MTSRTKATKVHFSAEEWELCLKGAAFEGLDLPAWLRSQGLKAARATTGKQMTLTERKAVEKAEAEAKRAENMRQHYAARDALTPRQRAEYDHLVGEHDEEWLHNYRNSLIAHVTNNF